MQDIIIEFLKQVNIVQLAAILIMFWFFYSRLDQKIEKNKNEMKDELGEIGRRIDKLSEKVEDVDRRLCRIEGSLSTHGHCLFNQAQPEKKAE
ncbi:MAG: hypothetical protein ACHQUC_04800 [Chlamydiales bacterium]